MIADFIGQGTAKALLAVFNHILSQHQWARDKLGMHVGRSILVGLETENLPKLPFLPPPEIRALISAEGLLREVPVLPSGLASGQAAAHPTALEKPSVEMRIKPSFEAMSTFGKEGPQGLLRHMKIEGDVLLAAALGEIASQARWDFEDDLSKVVGDIPARRIGRFVDDSKFAVQDGAQVLKGRTDLVRDRPSFPLLNRSALDSLDQKIEELGRRLDRLPNSN
jgi:ubiquinone biosynthesis accessory factor UbiJ